MAKGVTDRKHYEAIASAIRVMNGEATTYKPSQMAGAILDLDGGANLAKVSEIAIYDAIGMFSITYADGKTVTGSGTFDVDGNPTSLTDDQGNSVTFENGYPVSATDIYGNTVPILWG